MKRVLVGLAALAIGVCVFFLASPRQRHDADEQTTFDAFMGAMLQEAAIPGVAVTVLRDGQVVHSAGYGYADVERRRPMTPDTPINLASISKPVLGIALMRLREEGRLDIDADVNTYLPFTVDNPNVEAERITVRQLAAHAGSIADFYDPNVLVPGADAAAPVADYVRQLLARDGAHYDDGAHYLNAGPGAARAYSNLGAGLAGAVAEAAAGEPLASYQARTLFEPLGMNHTSWRIGDFGADELAVRYRVRQCAPLAPLCVTTEAPAPNEIVARVFDPPFRFKSFEAYPQLGNPNYPDGGLNASATDLAVLMQTLFDDGVRGGTRVLSSESMEEMFRLQAESLDERQRFFWRDRDGLTGHAGSDRGVFTYFYFDRASRNGFIVLMNRTPDAGTERAMDEIAARIRSVYFGQP